MSGQAPARCILDSTLSGEIAELPKDLTVKHAMLRAGLKCLVQDCKADYGQAAAFG